MNAFSKLSKSASTQPPAWQPSSSPGYLQPPRPLQPAPQPSQQPNQPSIWSRTGDWLNNNKFQLAGSAAGALLGGGLWSIPASMAGGWLGEKIDNAVNDFTAERRKEQEWRDRMLGRNNNSQTGYPSFRSLSDMGSKILQQQTQQQ